MGEKKERQLQITLVQTELEQAIREYVGRQFVLAEGNQMDIELSATRGAEGFKAVIDIVPIKPTSRPAIPPATSKAPAAVVAAAPAETEKPTEQTETHAETEHQEAPFDGGTRSAPDAPGDEHLTAAATHTEAAPAAAAGGARSLFKGLNKPKN